MILYNCIWNQKQNIFQLMNSSIQQKEKNQVPENAQNIKKMYGMNEKQYLKKFSKFLEQRLNLDPTKKQDVQNNSKKNKSQISKTNSLLATHLQKKKLTQNNSENRINKILNQFKSLDTYVNIKNFIQQMNVINRQSNMTETPLTVENSKNNTPPIINNQQQLNMIQTSAFENAYSKIFLKANLYVGNQINKGIIKNYQFINNFAKSLQCSQYMEEKFDPCSFDQLYFKELNQEGEINFEQLDFENLQRKQRLQQKLKQKIQKQAQASPLIINQKYYQDFKRKVGDIQCKLHQILESMYIKKWKKRKNQLLNIQKQKHTKNSFYSNNLNQNKPVISSKYKLYAPKNLFSFKEEKEKTENDWKKRRNGKILESSQIGKFTSTFKSQYSQKVFPQLSQAKKSKFYKKLSRENSKIKQMKNSKSNLFEELKKIKQNYNFKHPLLKQSILKKILDFIKDVQDRQYGFKKNNVEFTRSFNKFQQKKQLDFGRFIEQNLQIDTEEIKNMGLNVKKLR